MVLGREYPDATDYWDGNWVVADLSLRAGAFTARLRASLRTDEIRRFNKALKVLNKKLSGVAVLETLEEWLKLSITAAPRGQIEIAGELRDEPGSGNVLRFEFEDLDQTHLAGWIDSLDAIEASFPVIGRP